MSPLDDFDPAAALSSDGSRSHASRRLSDKILAAFNHAYAVGEADVAGKLRDALSTSEARHQRPAPRPGELRRGYDPLGQAELWVAFVEARNRYKALAEAGGDPARLVAKLEDMKDAYRRWSAV